MAIKKLYRKFVAMMLVMLCVFGTVSQVVAQTEDNIRILVNGEEIYFEGQQPIIVDERILIPVREVFEHLGARVTWADWTLSEILDTNLTADWPPTVHISFPTWHQRPSITISIGMPYFVTQVGVGSPLDRIDLDVPAQIINGRTMLPLCEVLDVIGYVLTWDADTRIVQIFPQPVPVVGVSLPEPIYVSMETHPLIGSWQFYNFSAPYPRMGAGSHIIIFSEDGVMTFRFENERYREHELEVDGNKIIFTLLDENARGLVYIFGVSENALTLMSVSMQFTRVFDREHYDANNPLIGRWKVINSTFNTPEFMELRADGTLFFETPGEFKTYGSFYIITEESIFLVWGDGMMAYYYHVSENSLTLFLTITEYIRIE